MYKNVAMASFYCLVDKIWENIMFLQQRQKTSGCF